MIKFRVIETKQKVQEEGAVAKTVNSVLSTTNALAALGSVFGLKTQFMYTVTGMIGNVKTIIQDVKNFVNIRRKSYGLSNNDLKVAETIRKHKLHNNIKDYVNSAIGYQSPVIQAREPEPESFSGDKTL